MDSDSSLTDLSSELSSVGSLSPVPDYPTPNSSQEQETSESGSIEVSRKHSRDNEELPALKKRKKAQPKPRTTERLDLTGKAEEVSIDQADGLSKLLQVLRKRRKIVVIAGAGISVSAGSKCHSSTLEANADFCLVPDFRSSTGLFRTLKGEHKLKASGKQLFDVSVYQTDSSTSSFHDMVRELSKMVGAAQPTAFHSMLSTLGLEGRLLRLYTQNVDGIDVGLPFLETEVPLSSKGPWPRTVQLHGGLEKMVCSKCNAISDFAPELFNGPEPPPCPTCTEADRIRTDHAGKRSHGVGKLRPRMALYNERTPDEDAIGSVMASDLRARPDALIVVGTSMKIPGVRRLVREMCGVIRGRRDGLTIWINKDGPPPGKDFEDCWDLVVKGPCDEVANQWNLSHYHEQCTESDVEQAKAKGDVEVMVSLKKEEPPLPTPAASPPPKQGEIKKIKFKVSTPQSGFNDKKPKPTSKGSSKVINPGKKKSQKSISKPKKKKPKDQKPSASLTSKFKLSKPGIQFPTKATKAASNTPSKKAAKADSKTMDTSSPLSSPHLPSSYKSSPATPSKTHVTLFPNLTPSKSLPSSNFLKTQRPDPLLPLRFHSSPPPYSPLTSPVRGEDSAIKREPRVLVQCNVNAARSYNSEYLPQSRPSSSRSGTVSPTSIPRGMESLLDLGGD